MTIQQSIQQTTASAQTLFGGDICIMVARAPAYGDDDTCILITGKRHAEAAKAFMAIKGAKRTTEAQKDLRGDTHTHTTVVF